VSPAWKHTLTQEDKKAPWESSIETYVNTIEDIQTRRESSVDTRINTRGYTCTSSVGIQHGYKH